MTNLSNTATLTNVAINTITPDIFEASTIANFIERIENLTPEAQGQWGKMNVAQMFRHMADTTLMTFGELYLSRPLIGRLIGKMVLKSVVKDDSPAEKNSPTHSKLKMQEGVDFDTEKQRFLSLIEKYNQKDNIEFEGRIHPFYGKMTSKEWSIWIYKHIDHHLNQFGA